MAKVKLNSMPDYTANIPKSPHDVSQSTGFTTPPGQISPVYFDMLHTGDELHFSASMFARMNPLHTAALGDIDVHLDYFFVPLTVMYTPASSMFYLTDDLISSQIDKDVLNPTEFPVFDAKGGHYPDSDPGDTWFDHYKASASSFAYYVGSGMAAYRYFDCVGKSIFRMWDFLDMAPYNLLTTASSQESYPAFTPWFALAYQAIYQLHPGFRNTDREAKLYNYNIDKWYQGMRIYDAQDAFAQFSADYTSIFMLRYANQPKDYFQSVKVSPMGSAVSMLKDPGEVFNSVNNWLNSTSFVPASSDPESAPESFSTATQTTSYLSSISSNNIRQLFMVDKLLRVIGRAEKNYESQFLAHFGVKIPHDSMHNITHIGHDVATLSCQPVISSANTFDGTNGSELGEVGGQGSVMLRGRKFDFKAPFHGVFMILAYFVPRVRYTAGFNKLHQLNDINQFWQPEFDKKGMQPLFMYEVSPDMDFSTTRLGWQFAYEQFKRKYDRVMYAFTTRVPDKTKVNMYSEWFVSSVPYVSIDYTGVATDEVPNSLGVYQFKVSPTSLNGIFVTPYDPRWSNDFTSSPWLIYQTDPFLCDFNLYCKKVNGMSEYGEPEL